MHSTPGCTDWPSLCMPATSFRLPYPPWDREGPGLRGSKGRSWGVGWGVKSFPDCSEPSPSPRASSGHRDTDLLPKMILFNAHTTFILGCKFSPASEEITMLLGVGGLATSPSPAGETDHGGGSASPGPHPYLSSHTLPTGVGRGGCPFPTGLRGLPRMGGWIWNLYGNPRGLGVPMCPDITWLPPPLQQPESTPKIASHLPKGP